MKTNKKGQAAMEFLMTYGWAILVVIAAIAALAYFGVLDPTKMLPERCTGPAGLDCIDKASISETGVMFVLRNNIGFPVVINNVQGVSCTGPSGGIVGTTGEIITSDNFQSFEVDNNEVVRLRVDCSLNSGRDFSDTFIVSYENTETGLNFDVPVEIRGKVI